MRKIIILLFLAVSLGELLSDAISLPGLHLVCKPLIMITLGIYYWLTASNYRSNVVVLAIVFSFAGDTALMFESYNENFFILGLVARPP